MFSLSPSIHAGRCSASRKFAQPIWNGWLRFQPMKKRQTMRAAVMEVCWSALPSLPESSK